ncbi:MAG: PilZ domain-containing protein [Heliobacteriaceae bacterium]|nr:PilZ domain-containing protein [Heliobacteriaceae bacterium]MDD4586913.1 PilZ domain-containing protein [Heliobacteriaceae bacterium]
MDQSKLKVNDLIRIIIPPGSFYSGHHKSRIEDVQKNTLILAAPFKAGVVISVRVGERLVFSKAMDNGIWLYQVQVLNRLAGKLPLLEVTKPVRAEKVQRRSFFRFPVALDTQYAVMDEKTAPQDWRWRPTIIRDISGGGVCLVLKEKLGIDQKMVLDVPLEDVVMRLQGCVRREFRDKGDQRTTWVYGVEFIGHSEAEKDKIVQYIFARQREMRRQGKA